MTTAAWESELERCYEVFDERHGKLREKLLTDLSGRPRARAAAPRPRRFVRSALALAACLLLLAGLWSAIPLATPAPAYGLDNLPQRLQRIERIYVHSWSYYPPDPQTKADRPPTERESYVERPNRYFSVRSDYVDGKVRRRRTVSDGQQRITIDDLAKTAALGQENPLAAEYKVQCSLQHSLCEELLGGPTAAGFQKLRSEKLAGVLADVYERIFQYPERPIRMRFVVWLNPATGLPLRSEQFYKFDDKPEELVSTSDKIDVNAPPPAGAFNFTPPGGYAVEHRDITREQFGDETLSGSGVPETGQKAEHGLRFCFNINDRAVLVCWANYNDFARRRETDLEGPVGRKLELTPTSSLEDRSYGHYFLRADSGPNFHWRWSLVVPTGKETTLSDGDLVFSIIDGGFCYGTLIGKPLRLDRGQLAHWVVEAQRLTLPENAPADAIFTLEQLETLAVEFRDGN